MDVYLPEGLRIYGESFVAPQATTVNLADCADYIWMRRSIPRISKTKATGRGPIYSPVETMDDSGWDRGSIRLWWREWCSPRIGVSDAQHLRMNKPISPDYPIRRIR